MRNNPGVLLLLAVGFHSGVAAQVIDFETLLNGAPTVEGQTISTEFSPLGVTFELLDRTTGLPDGVPRIARAGAPLAAFVGCYDDDLPYAGQGLGQAFLTDNTSIGVSGDLRITYSPPVETTSGAILDVDCRAGGAPPCEEWTITAHDPSGSVLDTVVLSGPTGASNPGCTSDNGPGDSVAVSWAFELPGQQIESVVIRYTGSASSVGLAFDNFAVASIVDDLDVEVVGPANEICAGQTVSLTAGVTGNWPYTYLWEEETSPNVWSALGSQRDQSVNPAATTRYRVTVTDATAVPVVSTPFTVEVVSGAGTPACDERILVSSFHSDRVLAYNPIDMTFVGTFVAAGSGGLNGANGLAFGRAGHLFVVSQATGSILRYDGSTGAFIDIFVSGLSAPVGLEVGPDGNLYVANRGTDSIRRFDGTTGADLGDFVAAGVGGLDGPTGLRFGSDGHLYVASVDNNSILRYDGQSGAFIGSFIPSFVSPRSVSFDYAGYVYPSSDAGDRVRKHDAASGGLVSEFVVSGSGTLNRANDTLFTRAGDLLVASFNNDKVLRFGGQSGNFVDGFPIGNGLNGPTFIASTQFCGDGICDPGRREQPCTCPEDCSPPPGSETACDDGSDDDCDGATDCVDTDCVSDPACQPAGALLESAVDALQVAKGVAKQLALSWGDSCSVTDSDYEVYQGFLGVFDSHTPVVCSTGGIAGTTFLPAHGNNYFLVVPRNGVSEGSYGRESSGQERTQGAGACDQQVVQICP